MHDNIDQDGLGFELLKHLYWNHFGRKNLAFLYAMLHGAKYIYDTDDDNLLRDVQTGIPIVGVDV